MKEYIKKLSMQWISTILIIALTFSNISAMMPKVNKQALINKFQKQITYNRDEFNTNPSGDYTGEILPIRYDQPGGTHSNEIRDVYVWNLPGAVTSGPLSICNMLMDCMNSIGDRLNQEMYSKSFKTAQTNKNFGKGLLITNSPLVLVDLISEFTSYTKQDVVKAMTDSMKWLNLRPENQQKFENILKEGLGLFSNSKAGRFARWIPYVAMLAGAGFVIYGTYKDLDTCAKLNTEASNLSNARSIILTYFNLLGDQKYVNANILVVAIDNSKIEWTDPFRQREQPYIGFWKCNELIDFKAPVFKEDWESYANNDRRLPAWASHFLYRKDTTKNRIQQGDVRGALEYSDQALSNELDRVKNVRAGTSLPPAPSRPAIEDKKTTLK